MHYLLPIDCCQRVATRRKLLRNWRVCIVNHLCLGVWKSRNCSECFSFADCWCKLKYVVEETKNVLSICKTEECTEATTKYKKVGEIGFKNIRSKFGWCVSWVVTTVPSRKEKLFTLGKEDIWHFTWYFRRSERWAVTSQLNRYLVGFLHGVYQCTLSLFIVYN